MNTEFEYYRIHRENDNSIPLLDEYGDCPDYFYQNDFINEPKVMAFKLGKPIPKSPKMADYHSTPNSIISMKIKMVIESLKVEKIQLIPAIIHGRENKIYEEYWAVHVYNRIKCIDEKLSDCESDGWSLSEVKKLVLNTKLLGTIPLNKRKVFRLEEDFGYQLYHKSIMDAILAVNPVGVRFTHIEQWNEGSFFR